MDDFYKQKIIYAETMRVHKGKDCDRFPRFSYSDEEIFLDKTCFIITGQNLNYILALLNSELSQYLIRTNVAVLDVGGFLMQKIYIEQLPAPKANLKSRAEIENLLLMAIKNRNLGLSSIEFEDKIDSLVYSLYGLTNEEVMYIKTILNNAD